MNFFKINYRSVLPVFLFALSCTDPVVSFSRIEYRIPGYIDIKTDDLNRISGDFKTDPASAVYVEVVLYSYSAGAEKISLSGDGEFKTVSGNGRLKALVKVMNDKKILRAEFVEGRGNSKEEMLSSLGKEIKLKMIK